MPRQPRTIRLATDVRPEIALVADLYRRAGLVRPVDDPERLEAMYRASNLVVSAWEDHRLVGILRGWTDGAYDGYVCDLAVAPEHARRGIGRALLERARASAGPDVQWVLRASKVAAEYYGHLGWRRIENGWYWPRRERG